MSGLGDVLLYGTRENTMHFRSILEYPAFVGSVALDALLPRRCHCCGQRVASDDGLCGNCWSKMPFLEKPWCQQLGTPFSHEVGDDLLSSRAIAEPPAFDRLRSVAFYSGPARELVLGLKFSQRREFAVPMGRWMARVGGEFPKDSMVVPVPLHWTRLWSRRFNQAAGLSRVVASITKGQFAPGVLARRKRTRQQVGLPAKERQRNVRQAFNVPNSAHEAILGRSIVLVDDVYTTGSTVTACTKALKRAGAASVDVLTFAVANTADHEDVPFSEG